MATSVETDEEESILLQQITPPGYESISYPRSNGNTGGGLAVVHKNHIQLQKHCILQSLVSMECGHFQIKFGLEMVSLFIIYCIPNTSVFQFCEEMVSISENSIEINNNKNYNNNNKYNKLLQQHNYNNTATTTQLQQ